MKIAIATDHNGVNEKKELIKLLSKYDFLDKSPVNTDTDDYPDFAFEVANSVVSKEADLGVLLCGTGIGMSIAANKVKGIRCAKIDNKDEARSAKEHNNANILAFSSQSHTAIEIKEMIDVFVNSTFNLDERYIMRIRQVENYEETNEY